MLSPRQQSCEGMQYRYRPSFRNILVNTLESTSFNGFCPNLVHTQSLRESGSLLIFKVKGQGHQVKFLCEGIRHALHCTCFNFFQEPITVAGRICCDSNGKLNAKSVILEGSRDTSMGKCIPLDLTELKQYSMFPGQVLFLQIYIMCLCVFFVCKNI